MNEIAESIIKLLLPDATPSRRRMMERSLSTMTPGQLQETLNAVSVAVMASKLSQIRDLIESRDLLSIRAIGKWEQWIDLRAVEGALNQELAVRDLPYDVYSPAFEAHVEAYVTYHRHCTGNCSPYDIDAEYGSGNPEPEPGHYVDYLQDYVLMEIVEKHPDRVTDLVKLAAERRGIDRRLLKEYLSTDTSALSSGLL